MISVADIFSKRSANEIVYVSGIKGKMIHSAALGLNFQLLDFQTGSPLLHKEAHPVVAVACFEFQDGIIGAIIAAALTVDGARFWYMALEKSGQNHRSLCLAVVTFSLWREQLYAGMHLVAYGCCVALGKPLAQVINVPLWCT